MARVRLAVGDGGIGRLESDDQERLGRIVRRRARAVGGEVGQLGARDAGVVRRREAVGRIGEGEVERSRRPSR